MFMCVQLYNIKTYHEPAAPNGAVNAPHNVPLSLSLSDGCAGVHMKQLYSLHKRAVKFLMPIPNLDYKQKCCALKLLPLDKQLLLNKCVLMQKVVHGKAPQYLKDLMIPSERLHVHGNKQLLPRTRIDIFKTSFSFSGSLAWNSLAIWN